MNRTTRSTGFYILLGMLCIFLIFALRDSFNGRSDITERELTAMLEKGQVSKVLVVQNEEVPTGTLQVTTSENEVLTVNVTDTTRAVEKLSEYDVTVSIEDVSRRSTLFTMIIPVLMTGALVVFLIMFLNRQQGGGGSAMMNFGRSHLQTWQASRKRRKNWRRSSISCPIRASSCRLEPGSRRA